ncbi:MAG: vitamin K epoxide reductase family protein [Parcubacteria group bacterium]|nr:vitamin K epoxide reductase family protein [Parcubacteria group bacterium]
MKSTGLKNLSWAAIILSFIGLADSAYLAANHYSYAATTCLIVSGCDKVLTSSYATIGTIPVAILGIVYYFLIIALFGAYVYSGNKNFLTYGGAATFMGFLATLWFLYLQVFKIKALCTYCLISAFVSILLLLISAYIIKISKNPGVS